ncbi:MAG: hypothetical protein OEY14_09465 [Myxococcales bacterium]|nr:hypothetical protein [Myxococcales bacterium]
MSSPASFNVGDFVRVKGDCRYTLPHYAYTFAGEVLGVTEDGMVEVRFRADRSFPVPAECLMLTERPPE